jgi:phytoene/squalene synthetase
VLPVDLFEDLLSAFRQDVLVTRYATWADLLDYCRRSANPVGRLVLRICGYREPQLDAWSDDICTALQLTNFWQDIAVDHARGRTYLPQDEALAAAVARTRGYFESGKPLCDAVRGRLRYELRATWLGGMRILDRVGGGARGAGSRPTLGLADVPWFAWKLLAWSGP